MTLSTAKDTKERKECTTESTESTEKPTEKREMLQLTWKAQGLPSEQDPSEAGFALFCK